jgi:5-methylcytosine-specific restriction endonuclease McrA
MNYPVLFCLFDIRKLLEPSPSYSRLSYASTACAVVWNVTDPIKLRNSILYHGDAASPNVFCIAIQNENRGVLETLQRALLNDPEFNRVAVAEKLVWDLKPVGFTGYPREAAIDENGNIQGKSFHAVPALDQVKQARLKGTTEQRGKYDRPKEGKKEAVRLGRWQCPKCMATHAWFDLVETVTCPHCGATFNAVDIYRMAASASGSTKKRNLSRQENTKQAVRLDRWQCPKCSWPHAWFDGTASPPPLVETVTCAHCGAKFYAVDIYRMGASASEIHQRQTEPIIRYVTTPVTRTRVIARITRDGTYKGILFFVGLVIILFVVMYFVQR